MHSYALSMRFLCNFYALSMLGSRRVLLKNRLFSRGISRACATRRNSRPASGAFAKRRWRNGPGPPAPLPTTPSHPGRAPCSHGRLASGASGGARRMESSCSTKRGRESDSSWLGPGSVLGRFWLHPGFVLAPSHSIRARKVPRIPRKTGMIPPILLSIWSALPGCHSCEKPGWKARRTVMALDLIVVLCII